MLRERSSEKQNERRVLIKRILICTGQYGDSKTMHYFQNPLFGSKESLKSKPQDAFVH